MTYEEWVEQTIELSNTMPDPDDVTHRELRRQMRARLIEIDEHLFNGRPEPAADWKPTVPDMTDAEKEAQRVKAVEWFVGEMEGMKRDLAEMDADGSGVGSPESGVGE